MARIFECPKCGVDISESYQSAEPDVGIGAGWYCDACDEGFGDEDGPEPHDDDVPLFGKHSGQDPKDHDLIRAACACRAPLEAGYGLAGGGIGPYMYCPHCGTIHSKSQDHS